MGRLQLQQLGQLQLQQMGQLQLQQLGSTRETFEVENVMIGMWSKVDHVDQFIENTTYV